MRVPNRIEGKRKPITPPLPTPSSAENRRSALMPDSNRFGIPTTRKPITLIANAPRQRSRKSGKLLFNSVPLVSFAPFPGKGVREARQCPYEDCETPPG